MLVEITRLVVGLLIALFHRPMADFLLRQERMLCALCRQNGLRYPLPPSMETVRTGYFAIGIGLAMYEIVCIWAMLHPQAVISAFFIR